MIDLRYVKKLIEILDESTVDSIEISTDKGMKIRLSKSPQQRGVQMAASVPMPAMLPAPAGRATRMVGVNWDVTTERRAQAEVVGARDEAERVNRQLEDPLACARL